MIANRGSLQTSAMFLLLVVSRPALAREAERTSLGNVASRVIQEFEHINSLAGAHEYLQSARPGCIPPFVKARLLRTLPITGEAKPTANGRSKLSAIDCVLEYHARKTVFVVKVIVVNQAFMGLHGRSILLISGRALELLTAEELRAVVAHEIGHEYFWEDYQSAARLGDPGKMRELELRCDAVAVLTLLILGADPAALLSGVSKLESYNRLAGATGNVHCYVSMKERTGFVRALVAKVMGNRNDWKD